MNEEAKQTNGVSSAPAQTEAEPIEPAGNDSDSIGATEPARGDSTQDGTGQQPENDPPQGGKGQQPEDGLRQGETGQQPENDPDGGGPSEITESIEQISRVRRIAQISAGVVLVLLGLLMSGPGIPGPGIAVIIVGLNLIKPNNRLSRWLRRKAPGVPEEGPIPRRQLVILAAFTIFFTVASILAGPTILRWILDTTGLSLEMPFT